MHSELSAQLTRLWRSVDKCSEVVLELDDLVADLNRTSDLPLFIRAMRRQFKKLV